jgi:hypothetical protein
MNSFYLICESDFPGVGGTCDLDNLLGFGGTSFSSPAFAGIMALVDQKWGQQGNPDFVLYEMPNIAGGNSLHDVPAGSTIAMPCTTGTPDCVTNNQKDNVGVLSGYSTTAAYDLATGLGSVNAANLVNNWNAATAMFTPTTTTLTVNNGTAVNMTHGSAIPVKVSVSPNPGSPTQSQSEDVALIVSPGTSGATPPNPGIDFNSLTNGTVTWNTTVLPGGTYKVIAHYEGDTTFGGSYSSPSASVTINPESSSVYMGNPPGLVVGQNPTTFAPVYGNSVIYGTGAFDDYLLRADVYNSGGNPCSTEAFVSTNNQEVACPTGKITITDNGSPLDGGTFNLNSEGYTEDQGIQLTGGSHTLVATYSGDPSYKTSNTTASITVAKATSVIGNVQTTLSSVSVGQQFTVSATVNTSLITDTSFGLAPTGTVSFFYNTTQLLGTVALTPTNGSFSSYSPATQLYTSTPASLAASLTTSISTAGTYNITATYSGDGNYTAVTAGQSNSVSITVSAPTPGYTLSAGAANPTSVSPGSSSTATVTATPVNGYTGTVTLSCSISPVVAGVDAPTCSLSPNPMTVTSSGGSSTLTFATVAASSDLQRAMSGTTDRVVSAKSNPNPTAKPSRMKLQFFALWLPISGLTLVGFVFGFSATQRKKTRLLCLICLLSTALILLPSCGGGGSGGNTSCLAVPGVPTGLAASNTTSSGTTLTWTAPTGIPANCTLTGYTVYQNGDAIATTTSPTYTVTGLTAGTQYSFTVAANDSFGVSPQSSPVSVTTTGATGTPAGTYTISITGKDANGVTQTGNAATVTVTVN